MEFFSSCFLIFQIMLTVSRTHSAKTDKSSQLGLDLVTSEDTTPNRDFRWSYFYFLEKKCTRICHGGGKPYGRMQGGLCRCYCPITAPEWTLCAGTTPSCDNFCRALNYRLGGGCIYDPAECYCYCYPQEFYNASRVYTMPTTPSRPHSLPFLLSLIKPTINRAKPKVKPQNGNTNSTEVFPFPGTIPQPPRPFELNPAAIGSVPPLLELESVDPFGQSDLTVGSLILINEKINISSTVNETFLNSENNIPEETGSSTIDISETDKNQAENVEDSVLSNTTECLSCTTTDSNTTECLSCTITDSNTNSSVLELVTNDNDNQSELLNNDSDPSTSEEMIIPYTDETYLISEDNGENESTDNIDYNIQYGGLEYDTIINDYSEDEFLIEEYSEYDFPISRRGILRDKI